MSGIAGIIRFDGTPVAPGLVEKMTAAMAYRGPDGIHHWARGSVALGQCMLRTTPESLEETQPLANEDASLVLVMDGRVDNWEELRRELLARGARLRSRADAELVLRAYETWGRECLAHIDGDFALVIWDARKQTAFCARDRMGNKPLHYHWDGRTFAFASELHPILALPWVQEQPNEGMLAEFLAAEWHSRDETLWLGILRLVAAHAMRVDAGGPRPEQYWAPDLWATLPCTTDAEYAEHYRELLFDSVRRQSRSHRPLAIDVSGGLDSSAVFCVAEYLRRAGRLPAPAIEGYTLAFTDDSAANELAYARAVGEYLGLPIHEVAPTTPPLSWYVERARRFREFPGFPNASMFLDIREQAGRQGMRVELTGEGGDQWLDGSEAYYAEELAQRHWAALYDCFSQDVSAFGTRHAVQSFLRHGCLPLLPAELEAALRRTVRKLRGRPSVASEGRHWLSRTLQDAIRLRQERSRSLPQHTLPLHRLGQRQLLNYLHDAFTAQIIERVEREGAHAGVEIRHPLHTPQMAQFAFSTPERLRLRGDRTKYFHRLAMRQHMPPAVLERSDKAEFSVVIRGHLDRMEEALSDGLPRDRPEWLDPAGTAQLFGTYRNNPEMGWPIWILWSIWACDALLPRP